MWIGQSNTSLQRTRHIWSHSFVDRVHNDASLHSSRHLIEEHLQEHVPKGIYLTALSDLASLHVEWTCVAWRATRELTQHVLIRASARDAAEAKVRHFGLTAVIDQQDVSRLHVPVERARGRIVKMCQSCGGVAGSGEALVPKEGHLARPATFQALVQVSTTEVLVEQEASLGLAGPAYQNHQVWVPELAQHSDLLLEASSHGVSTQRRQVDHLHGNIRTVGHLATVHGASGPRSQTATEAFRHRLHLDIRIL
jgi:hypothetical protein